MKTRLLAPLAAFALALVACHHHDEPAHAGGPPVTQQRSVATFTKITLKGPVRLEVHEGRDAKVTATTPGSPDDLITRVEGDTLVVDRQHEGCWGLCFDTEDRDTAHVVVEMPRLDALSIDGSGDASVQGAGEHSVVALAIEGSGDLHYEGDADVLQCAIEGSGDIVAVGRGKRLEATIEGSGDVNARAFHADGGKVVIEGSGDVYADIDGDASVRIDGSGDLHYTGQARFTDLDLSGSGEVVKR